SVIQLRLDRFVDGVIAISKRDWTYCHRKVDVLVAVHIPAMRTLAPLNIFRRHPSYVLTRTFRQRLSRGRNQIQCAGVVVIRLGCIRETVIELYGVWHSLPPFARSDSNIRSAIRSPQKPS